MEEKRDQTANFERENLTDNEQRLLHFTLDCLHGVDESLIDDYVAENYIQHTHGIGQGREGLRRYVTSVAWKRPGRFKVQVLQLFAAGDFVILHKSLPAVVIVDIMRFDHQHQFVEHWDVVQRAPVENYDPMALSSEDFARFKTLFR